METPAEANTETPAETPAEANTETPIETSTTEATTEAGIFPDAAEIIPMILNKEYPVYTEEGESVWFSFAVQETGEYRFASLGDTDTRASLYNQNERQLLVNEREDDGENGENFGFVCRLDAGQTYYLEAGAANGQSGGFAVRAERYQPEMNALKVLTAETLETGAESEITDVRFVQMPEDAYYVEEFPLAYSMKGLTIEFCYGDGSFETLQYGSEEWTEKGIYTELQAYEGSGRILLVVQETGESWYSGSIEARSVTEVGTDLSGKEEITAALDSEKQYYYFTADQTQAYYLEFTGTGQADITWETGYGSQSASYQLGSDAVRIDLGVLTAGNQSAICAVYSPDALGQSVSVKLQGEASAVTELSLNQEAVIKASGVNYYSFTPSEDGYYRFWTAASSETASGNISGMLEDYYFNWPIQSGSEMQAMEVFYLKGGETYIFEAYIYETGTEGVLKLVRANAARLEILRNPDRMEYVSGYDSWIDPTGMELRITYEDGVQEAVDPFDSSLNIEYAGEYLENGYNFAPGAQKVVLEMNGASAELTIQVKTLREAASLLYEGQPVSGTGKENGSPEFFSFTADEAGMYAISGTNGDMEASFEMYDRSENAIGWYTGVWEGFLQAGETVLVCLYPNVGVSYTLKAEKQDSQVLTAGSGQMLPVEEAGKEYGVRIVPEESGFYKIILESPADFGGNAALRDENGREMQSTGLYGNAEFSAYLEAGKSCWLLLYGYSGLPAEISCSISKTEGYRINGLSVDAASLTLPATAGTGFSMDYEAFQNLRFTLSYDGAESQEYYLWTDSSMRTLSDVYGNLIRVSFYGEDGTEYTSFGELTEGRYRILFEANGHTAELALTMAAIRELPALAPGENLIPESGTARRYYRFTAEKTGTYTVTLKEGDTTLSFESEGGSYEWLYSPGERIMMELQEGETFLMKAGGGASFTLSIAETQAPEGLEILPGTSTLLADEEYGDFLSDWGFRFRYPDGEGAEVGFHEEDNKGNIPDTMQIRVRNEAGEYDSDYSENWNQYAQGIYTLEFRLNETYLGEAQISAAPVTEMEAQTLSLNGTAEVPAETLGIFRYTPEESGVYYLMCVSEYARIRLYDAQGTCIADSGEAALLTQGETYYYVCRGETERETVLQLIKPPVYTPGAELTLSDLADMTESNHECYTFVLSAAEPGRYVLESDGYIEILEYMRSFDGSAAAPADFYGSATPYGVSIDAAAGLYLPTIFQLEGSMSIRQVPELLSLEIDAATVAEEYISGLDTADSLAYEILLSYSDGSEERLESGDTADRYGNEIRCEITDMEGNPVTENILPAGSYFIHAACGELETEFPITVVPLEEKAKELSADGAWNRTDNALEETIWSFTAPETGDYELLLNTDGSFRVLDTEFMEIWGEWQNDGSYLFALQEGTTYLILVDTEMPAYGIRMRMVQPDAIAVTGIALREAPVTVAGLGGYWLDGLEVELSYSTGIKQILYGIYDEDAYGNSFEAELYNASMETVAEGPLAAGRYTLQLTLADGSFTDSREFAVKTAAEASSGTIGEEKPFTCRGSKVSRIYRFVPEHSGEYAVEGWSGSFYRADETGFLERHYGALTAGEEYYLVLNEIDGSVRVTLYWMGDSTETEETEDTEEPEEPAPGGENVLTLGKPAAAAITSPGQTLSYTFTPEENGVYVFSSSGDYDTFAVLYQNGEELNADDDGKGEGNNFQISESLTAGMEYTYEVRMYSSDATGVFQVLLEKQPELQSMELLYSGEGVSYIYPFDTPYEVKLKLKDETGGESIHTIWEYTNELSTRFGTIEIRRAWISETEPAVALEIQAVCKDMETAIRIPMANGILEAQEISLDTGAALTPSDTDTRRIFVYRAEESGRVRLRMPAQGGYIQKVLQADSFEEVPCSNSAFEAEKGVSYYMDVWFYGIGEGESAVLEKTQRITGIELIRLPENPLVLYGIAEPELYGGVVRITYEDGSQQEVSYGGEDTYGNSVDGSVYEKGLTKYRLVYECAGYRDYADIPADSAEGLPEIKAGVSQNVDVTEEIAVLQFTPEVSGGYQISYELLSAADDDYYYNWEYAWYDDTRQVIYYSDYYSGWYMQAGKTYYLKISGFGKFSVTVRQNTEGQIASAAEQAEELKNQFAQGGEITDSQREEVRALVEQTAQMDSQALSHSENTGDLLRNLDELVVKAGLEVKGASVAGEASGGASVAGAAAAAAADTSLASGRSYQAVVNIENGSTDYSGGTVLYCRSHKVFSITMDIVDADTGEGKKAVQPAIPLQITAAVPEEYQGKEFALYHVTGGEGRQLDYFLSADGSSFTFVTPSLSDFVIVLTDCGEGKHSLKEEVIQEASCTAAGEKEIYCTDCLYTDYAPVAASGHQWKTVVDKAATCGAAGSQHQECGRCGLKTGAAEVPATGNHTWKTVIDKAATCGAQGQQHRECTVCGRKEAASAIPATGRHSYAWITDVPATCGRTGSRHQECTVCHVSGATEAIPATGNHAYRTVTLQASSCSKGGSQCRECTVCGYRTPAQGTPATGNHTWYTVIDRPASCGTAGSQHQQCRVCGIQQAATAIPATGQHSYKTVVDKAATCGAAGSQHRECTVCGRKEAAVNIAATGRHNYKNVVDKKATCAKAGSQHQECTVCGAKQKATSIKATGKHRYGSYKVTRKATVLKSGRKTRTCKVCGKKETRTIAKLKATIKLAKTKITIGVKQTVAAPKVTYRSGDGIRSWTSSRKSVATVDKKGRITGKKTGTATITVKLKSGKTAKIKVTVKKKISTTKLTVNRKSLTLKKGKTYTLKVTVSPEYSQDKVTYKSSNKTIATVNSKGRITAKKKGTAKITIQSGKKKVTCKVKVK